MSDPAISTPAILPTSYQPERPVQPLTFSLWLSGVLRRRRTIALSMLAVAVTAVLAVLLIPPVYRAHASFVPNTSSSSLRLPPSISGMRGLGGLASQLSLGAGADPSQSPGFYAELISSRELRTRLLLSRFPDPRTEITTDSVPLIDLLRIRNRDPERRMELGLRALQRTLKTEHDEETNIVKLSADAEWRVLAAGIANRTIEFVSEFNREQRTSRARSNRNFLENRVRQVYDDLRAAESRQRVFYETNRAWRTSPALSLQEQQLQREVDRTADLYLALQQQLENSRLEEVNDAAMITVVDSAVTPKKAEWPRYGLLLMSTVLGGLLLGVLIAGTATVYDDWRNRNPEAAAELRASVPGLRYVRRRRTPARARGD